ncbi:MAG: non-heme iron oxygenase ferredoxin subunit [Gammaproteobacteria bacterium]|jgi:ethylbenzene dioxygenase ferredoxin component|nr:non-heme iron oxygenase ferredoxin subunit [Gammaproteobacteria bacterium]
MSELVILCKTEEVVEGTPLAITADGFPPLAAYLHEGTYYVTDNTCTHGMAMLTEGYQDGHEIECPFHGGAFDITNGEAVSFPCQIALKSYTVTLDSGNICVPASEAVAS